MLFSLKGLVIKVDMGVERAKPSEKATATFLSHYVKTTGEGALKLETPP
jgi:hypothetical protein